VSSLVTPVGLTPIDARHPAARRYLLARRRLLPRDQRVVPVAGLWAHRQLLRLGASTEVFLWCPARDDRADQVSEAALAMVDAAATSYVISERTLARLHPGARAPGLLSLAQVPTWSPASVLNPLVRLVLVADGIEYAGNLGSLVRTVDASGADTLVLTNPVARLTHPTVFSASRGTVLTTPIVEYAGATGARAARAALEAAGLRILVADPEGSRDYRQAGYGDQRTAIVVGSEGNGVSQEWRRGGTERISISMRGRADSLNVASAAAILLFEAVVHDRGSGVTRWPGSASEPPPA
jgi:TrmH family RNA methyltransferase